MKKNFPPSPPLKHLSKTATGTSILTIYITTLPLRTAFLKKKIVLH